MNEDKISLELKSNLSELNTLRENLDKFAKGIGMSPKCLFEIHLAMEEIVANIISHGCVENPDQCIRITLSCENQTVVIRIEDCGIPFNLLTAEAPDLECSLEESKIGGLGIHLIKKLMNDVQYERCDEKNVVILKKNIK